MVIDAELEQRIFHDLRGPAERALDEHINSNGQNGPLYAPDVLASAARVPISADTREASPDLEGTSDAPQFSRDAWEYGPVLRESHLASLGRFASEFQVDVKPVLGSMYYINKGTELNLAHYGIQLDRVYGKYERIKPADIASHPYMLWINRWLQEEFPHTFIMNDYDLETGITGDSGLVSHELQANCEADQLLYGTKISPENIVEGTVYLTLQELLTVYAHNGLSLLQDKMGRMTMRPISGAEEKHYKFYFKQLEALKEMYPDELLVAMNKIFPAFRMPGENIPEFDHHAGIIGTSGIFDLVTILEAKKAIIVKLGLEKIDPVTLRTDEAKIALQSLLESVSERAFAEQQQIMDSTRPDVITEGPDGLLPFILGRTIAIKTEGGDTITVNGETRVTKIRKRPIFTRLAA